MILLGLGSNLPHAGTPPAETLAAAIAEIARFAPIVAQSRIYRSQAWPDPEDPPFCNAVIAVATDLAPAALLEELQRIERAFGRRPGRRNAPRPLDIDIIDYDGRISRPEETPQTPHPRLQERLFVLAPLEEIAPDWRHPATGEGVRALIDRAAPDPVLAALGAA